MELALLTYLVLTIPEVANGLLVLLGLAALVWLLYGLAILCEATHDEDTLPWRLHTLRHLKWVIPVVALCMLVPTKEDAKVIAGVYIAAEAASWVSEVEGVSQLPGNLVEFINNKLVPVEED